MHDLLIEAGFTDIQENPDHTFNATKDGEKYFNLYVSGIKDMSSSSDLISIPVTWRFE